MATLCAAFPLGFLHKFGGLSTFDFLANDTFYYLSIARNSHRLPFYSFDGITPTNGFHPLWQYLLSLMLPAGVGLIESLETVFLTCVGLMAISVAINSMTVSKPLSRPWLQLPFVVPGLSWILLSPIAPDYLAVWSFANGMETSLSLVLFSSALHFLCLNSSRSSAVGMIFMSFAVLARLDDVFVLLGLWAFLWASRSWLSKTSLTIGVAFPLFAIGAYLFYNYMTVGIFFPSSGAAKAGFALPANVKSIASVILPYISWEWPNYLRPHVVDYSVFAEISMREFQLMYSAIVCTVFIVLRRRGFVQRPNAIFVFLAYGILLKCCYNFVFVSFWQQGHWYFAVALMVSNMLALFIVDDLLRAKLGVARWNAVGVVFGAVFAVLLGNVFVNHKSYSGWGESARDVFKHRFQIRDAILATGADKFVEFNDGELAWATGLQAVSGLGLALDPATQRSRRDGHFLQALHDRGYRIGVASGAYASHLQDRIERHNWERGGDLWGIRSSEFNEFDIREVSKGAQPALLIFEFVPTKRER